MKLRKHENVYQDPHGGPHAGWIAELENTDPERSREHWTRLGTFGTREAAIGAVVRSRPS